MTQITWHIISTKGHEIGQRAIVDNMGFTICNPSPMGKQSAALIAAAPDLIEALFIALPFVEDHEDSPTYKPQAVTNALKIIRAALTKATDLDAADAATVQAGEIDQ